MFYDEMPIMDVGGAVHDGVNGTDDKFIAETVRLRACLREGQYGI